MLCAGRGKRMKFLTSDTDILYIMSSKIREFQSVFLFFKLFLIFFKLPSKILKRSVVPWHRNYVSDDDKRDHLIVG